MKDIHCGSVLLDLDCSQITAPVLWPSEIEIATSVQLLSAAVDLAGLKPEECLIVVTDLARCQLAQVLRCKGPVVKGFGRGSKMLGIPTANLEAEALAASLQEVLPPCGIYGGWASVGNSATVYQMVMSIGWNPYFDNKQKSVEPWLLHEFPEDFYGEELRLLVDHYIRPEANFTTLEALMLLEEHYSMAH
eukprot:gene2360-3090_t